MKILTQLHKLAALRQSLRTALKSLDVLTRGHPDDILEGEAWAHLQRDMEEASALLSSLVEDQLKVES